MNPGSEEINGTNFSSTCFAAFAGSGTPSYRRTVAYILCFITSSLWSFFTHKLYDVKIKQLFLYIFCRSAGYDGENRNQKRPELLFLISKGRCFQRGFFRKIVSTIATPASTAAMEKLPEKLPVLSARIPATAGPMIWPKPKIKVTNPNACPALCAPT